jgi:hypothetical protein
MYRYRLLIVVIILSVSLLSCYKPELVQFKKVSSLPTGCNASSFFGITSTEGGAVFNGFTKTYDAKGRITEVVAPIFGLILTDSIRLTVVYFSKEEVKFVNAANSDTVIIARFNSQGRLIQMAGNTDYSFANTDFIYSSNRLSSINLTFGTNVNFQYDSKGNVIRYQSDNEGGLDNVIFTYDLSVKVADQVYIDYIAGWIYNSFTLAQIMGTHATILFDKTDPWYDVEFTDHTFDKHGRLTSYLAGEYKMIQTWNCK